MHKLTAQHRATFKAKGQQYWDEYEAHPVIALALAVAIAEILQSIERIETAIEMSTEDPLELPTVSTQCEREMEFLSFMATTAAKGPQPVGRLASSVCLEGVAAVHHIHRKFLED